MTSKYFFIPIPVLAFISCPKEKGVYECVCVDLEARAESHMALV